MFVTGQQVVQHTYIFIINVTVKRYFLLIIWVCMGGITALVGQSGPGVITPDVGDFLT